MRSLLCRHAGARVHVVDRSDLALLFAAALEHRGFEAARVDGAAAALVGLRRIEEEME